MNQRGRSEVDEGSDEGPALTVAGPLRREGGGAEHLGCGVFVSLSVSAPGPRRRRGSTSRQVRKQPNKATENRKGKVVV